MTEAGRDGTITCMKHGRNSQMIPVIIIVIIVVVSVAAIVTVAKNLFFSDGKDTAQTEEQANADVEALLSTNADRGVRMTVRGEITANEQFRSYQIVVTPTKRTMTTYAGYLDTIIDGVSYNNNTRAYEEFVYALNRANMVAGEPLTGPENDRRGRCASGKILEFETIQNDQTVELLWTSTCDDSAGSLEASASKLGNMFTDQVPASDDLLDAIHEKN